MNDATTMKPKPAKASAPVIPMMEMPKFEIPKFEIPKMEVHPAFREFAEKGVAQAKDGYEKMKAAAEESTEMLETFYSTANKGATEYGKKVLDIARANTTAMFDFTESLFGVKSVSELVELSTAHARSQYETLTAQSKELSSLAQKVATETAEPIKAGMSSAMKKVA